MRESIIIYRSFYEAIKELPTENQAEVWSAIFEYGINFKTVDLSGISKTIFTLIKPQLDANISRYKSGMIPKNKRKVSKKEANSKQNISEIEANVNVNDNDNDNVNFNVNNNVNDNVNEQWQIKFDRFIKMEIWHEEVAMALRCNNKNEVIEFLNKFFIEKRATGELDGVDDSAIKKHFFYWAQKQIEKNNNKKYAENIKSTERVSRKTEQEFLEGF